MSTNPSGSVCPACYAPFPESGALPSLPVGGRVAADEVRRRLWLVCGGCGEWSPAPVEPGSPAWAEVAAAAQEGGADGAGRRDVSPPLRVARVGAGGWASYAELRYSPLPGHRRSFPWRAVAWPGVFAAGAALFLVHPLAGLAVIGLGVMGLRVRGAEQPIATDRLNFALGKDGGSRPEIRGRISQVTVRTSPGAPRGFRVHLRAGSIGVDSFYEQRWELEDEDALVVLRFVLRGAARGRRADAGQVREAVREVEAAGGPGAFLASAERRILEVQTGSPSVDRLPAALRYALEIAATELEEDFLAAHPDVLAARWSRARESVARGASYPIPR
ncbi:MAG: hypothetical protein AB1941_16055 [Gemmatimonadota bacterium]